MPKWLITLPIRLVNLVVDLSLSGSLYYFYLRYLIIYYIVTLTWLSCIINRLNFFISDKVLNHLLFKNITDSNSTECPSAQEQSALLIFFCNEKANFGTVLEMIFRIIFGTIFGIFSGTISGTILANKVCGQFRGQFWYKFGDSFRDNFGMISETISGAISGIILGTILRTIEDNFGDNFSNYSFIFFFSYTFRYSYWMPLRNKMRCWIFLQRKCYYGCL